MKKTKQGAHVNKDPKSHTQEQESFQENFQQQKMQYYQATI